MNIPDSSQETTQMVGPSLCLLKHRGATLPFSSRALTFTKAVDFMFCFQSQIQSSDGQFSFFFLNTHTNSIGTDFSILI